MISGILKTVNFPQSTNNDATNINETTVLKNRQNLNKNANIRY